MKKKKIWLLLGLLFLILSLSLIFQTFNERNGFEEVDAENNQIESKDVGVENNTLKEAKEPKETEGKKTQN